MRTEEIKIYNFEELSDKAKEKARDWWKNDGLDEHERDSITESFQEKLEKLGLPTEKVCWGLSCCQGDGVAFYGNVDIEDYLTKNKLKTTYKELLNNGDVLIWDVEIYNNNHHYNHYNTMSIRYNLDYNQITDELEELAEELTDHILSHIKEISKDFETSGYKQIDYYNSDEYVDEVITANEYEFTENGDHWL